MRNCLWILVAGVMLCVPLGCSQDSGDEPAAYDSAVDGPPVAIGESALDYEIIGDPAKVAKRRRIFQEGVEGGGDVGVGEDDLTGPESDASQGEIADVKSVISKVKASEDAGDKTAALAFFAEDASTVMQGIIQAHADLQAKALQLDSVMKAKFVSQYPAAARVKIEGIPADTKLLASPTALLDGAVPEVLVFTKIGNRIKMVTPQKRIFLFSRVEGEWKVGFDKSTRQLLAVYGEILAASTKLLTDTSAGVEDGSITAANVEVKIGDLTETIVAPAKAKLTAMRAGATGGGDVIVPPATVPDATVPAATAPDAPVPDATVPATPVPDATVPAATVPDATVPEATVPEATVPEATVPDATVPDATEPAATVPDATEPAATVPDATAPADES